MYNWTMSCANQKEQDRCSTMYGCKVTQFPHSQRLLTKVHPPLLFTKFPTQKSSTKPSQADTQLQNVFSTLGISTSLSPLQKLNALRKIPASDLVSKIFDFDIHTFRGVTDDAIISRNLIADIHSGAFASRFQARGIRILLGEAETEEVLYALTNPPPSSSREDMLVALNNYYARPVCERILDLYIGHGAQNDERLEKVFELQDDAEKAKRLFGVITSDVQVRAPIRVLSKALFDGGVLPDRIMRYRVAYRPDCTDKVYPRSYGVTHSADGVSWWFVERYGFSEVEGDRIKEWLKRTLIPLVFGDRRGAGAVELERFLYFKEDGKIEVVDDQFWPWLMRVGETLGS